MTALYITLGTLFALLILYFLTVRCRHGHKMIGKLQGWDFAHRGLHGNGVPENSMEAFRLALEGGYGIELDVHLMADGNLAVIHDASLKRTAGVDVRIEDLTLADSLEESGSGVVLLNSGDGLCGGRIDFLFFSHYFLPPSKLFTMSPIAAAMITKITGESGVK